MINNNNNKTIVVIGATSEIGYHISTKLASNGYNLILTYHNKKKLIHNLKEDILNRFKIKISIVNLNLLDEEFNLLEDELNQLNKNSLIGMVFCAGYTHPKNEFFNIYLEDVKKVFLINVIAAHEISAIVAKKMKSNTSLKNGSIVFISSQIADYGSIGLSAYSASKGGLNSLGISLAKELGDLNIRVNTISPGPVITNKITSKDVSGIIESIPLKRICEPKDIANLVNFLFSEDSSFINGENIHLNGGR